MRVGVIGCGLIGSRRAQIVARDPHCRVAWVADADPGRAESLAQQLGTRGCAEGDLDTVDAVLVATPNGLAVDFAVAALSAGKHVLMEKPPGRNLEEARRLASVQGPTLKIGFNHRYYPALTRMYEFLHEGRIGAPVSLRARYGHGGRPGYEKEWRGDPNLAGGGVLLDQGIHLADLCHWLLGLPVTAYGLTQTAVWPLHPLEDSGFALLKYARIVASFHVAWTQWKNLFSLELFGESGSLSVEGLGGSYGPGRLLWARRKPQGGVPDLEEFNFPGEDLSWIREWEDFKAGVLEGKPFWGQAGEAVNAMRIIDALYRSSRSGQAEDV